MKALSKSPENRFQSGQDLVRELEQCNASVSKVAPPAAAVKPKVQAAGAAAGVGAKLAPKPSGPASAPVIPKPSPAANPTPKVAASAAAPAAPAPVSKPNFSVDPLMAEPDETSAAVAKTSFSELEELPPLKEAFVPSISPDSCGGRSSAHAASAAWQKGRRKAARFRFVKWHKGRLPNFVRPRPSFIYMGLEGRRCSLSSLSAPWRCTIILKITMATVRGPQSLRRRPRLQNKQLRHRQRRTPRLRSPRPKLRRRHRSRRLLQLRSNRKLRRQIAADAPRTHAAAPVVAQLTVSSVPPGAQITFDGSPLVPESVHAY